MAATHSSNTRVKKMMTCPRPDPLTSQPSNLSNYEGYHGDETASVPFTWEWQPGTPKHPFRETNIPPLTPPPSHYSYAASSSAPRPFVKAHKNKNYSASKSSLLQSILPKRTSRKSRGAPPPLPPSSPANSSSPSLSFCSSSSSSSSSSYISWWRSRSVPSTPMRCPGKEKEDEEDVYDVPGSGMCFGNAGFRGRYSSMIKKVMLGDLL
ncbi:putative protein TPRXL [Neltuma alba]|uniref:putative protein TPRXL n=1 Tax=Neltuma alba TaxID=207710 RepID=UPI0010A51708|nr:putative protein TPRXL [Prosopis alba]